MTEFMDYAETNPFLFWGGLNTAVALLAIYGYTPGNTEIPRALLYAGLAGFGVEGAKELLVGE